MIIILFIFLILLIPIPIKITVHYSEDDYYLKLYKFNIFSKYGGLINNILNKKAKKNSNKKEPKIKKSKKKYNKKISIKKLYSNFIYNKFKPLLKFSADIDYSLNDSAITAISFGFLNFLQPIFYKIFTDFFKLKRFNLNFKPLFKDLLYIECTVKSIIIFNLAQIIYMLFLFLKSLESIEEVP